MRQKITGLLLGLFFSSLIEASSPPLTWNAAIGSLWTESHEYVHDSETHDQISQLNWVVKGAPVLQAAVSYPFNPRYSLSLNGWITLQGTQGHLDDFDWLNPNQAHWTDWSTHDDAQLVDANHFDLKFSAILYETAPIQWIGLLGYERSLFSYQARGGCYFYDNGLTQGCFPNGLLVGAYQQIFETPYLGLGATSTHGKFNLTGEIKYSPWVNARDTDQHFLRNLIFRTSSTHSDFYHLTLNAGYWIKPELQFFAEGTVSAYNKSWTGTTLIDKNDGARVYIPDTASRDNQIATVSLGLQYRT